MPRPKAFRATRPGQADPGAEGLGHRRFVELERQVEPDLVRHTALLRIPGEQGLQNAYPGAAVQVPQLYRMPDRGGARLKTESLLWRIGSSRLRTACCPPMARAPRAATSASCPGHGLEPRAARQPAGPVPARPDASADHALARFLRAAGARHRGRQERWRCTGATHAA